MQTVFEFDSDTHKKLLKKAKSAKAPKLKLHIKVFEAKELNPKDHNGLADPFVKLFIASAPKTKQSTPVKNETLNPTFQEHYSL
jgi:BAI1-associated protein 3